MTITYTTIDGQAFSNRRKAELHEAEVIEARVTKIQGQLPDNHDFNPDTLRELAEKGNLLTALGKVVFDA